MRCATYGAVVGDEDDPDADRPPTPDETRLIEALTEAVARRDASFIGGVYVDRLRASLTDVAEGSRGRDLDGPVGTWLQIVWAGDDPTDDVRMIDLDFWFDLVVASADATNDSGEAWCIADGPASHLIDEDESMMPRLQALRPTHPGVDAMFRAYQDDLTSMGYPHGSWGDEIPQG